MPNIKKENTVIFSRKPDNFFENPVLSKGVDCSLHIWETFHLERDGTGVKIVSDGKTDFDKLVQEEACNAGLVNILKMQEIRYGTVENAIKRNEARQVYADVSKVPTSVAEQQEYVANAEKEVAALCSKLGISKDELIKMNIDSLSKLVADKAAATSGSTGDEEGGK